MRNVICSIDGCERGGKLTRKMCAKHYRYWIDHTPPEERGLPPRFDRTFWEFVDKSSDCWIWTGPRDRQGYGAWNNLGGGDARRGLAHRIALAEREPCPDPSLFACHHCDNPPCVRPDHLYWGTVQDNVRDVVTRQGVHNKGQHPTHCKRGHAMTSDNIRVVGREERWLCRTCDNMRSRERQRMYRAQGKAS